MEGCGAAMRDSLGKCATPKGAGLIGSGQRALLIGAIGAVMLFPLAAYGTVPASAISIRLGWNDSSCSDTINWSTAVDNWRSEMDAYGVNLGVKDTGMYWHEFTDYDYGGEDHINENADTSDAIIVGSHGWQVWTQSKDVCDPADSCVSVRHQTYLSTTSGSPTGCWVETDSYAMGDNQTEFYDDMGCYSNEPDLAAHMTNHTYRLHQWHGFYGISNVMVGVDTDDYVDDAFDGSVSHAWVEQMTRWDAWPSTLKDICATSLVRGATEPDAVTRSDYETFGNANYSTDPRGWSWAYYYYCLCDPNHVNDRPIGC